MNNTIERIESEVRSYCRAFPTVFTRAEGASLHDEKGRSYIDFFAGAGTLNYGHNHPLLKERLLKYIADGGITHGLDMATSAKVEFLDAFEKHILLPRDLNYKVMFPGPTGTNAVEAAIKLARKVTGRPNVAAFTNGFHGMTLGSLALTGNASKREGAGLSLGNVTRLPFEGFHGPDVDTIDIIDSYLSDPSSGVDAPAAFIVETVQGEGGINVARNRWLRRLSKLARAHGALFIVDDIQMGCGRTGSFFSFEEAGIEPDIVCLSKSISGYGLPFALTLFRPELDVWSPGEHNGTFRGNNLAFVTGTATIEHFWSDDTLMSEVEVKSTMVQRTLRSIAERFGGRLRGRGFVYGIAFDDHHVAGAAASAAFEQGLLVETSGSHGEVLKFLASLTITDAELGAGLSILESSVAVAMGQGEKGRPARVPVTRTDSPVEARL
ncbi:MAG: diaminobutyrate-2-oxoglutarate transaminase [Polyangiales bacterium]|jgi:diaminobutyrate-2-oxoglutarate transaminase